MYKQVRFGQRPKVKAIRSALTGVDSGMAAFLPGSVLSKDKKSEPAELPRGWLIEGREIGGTTKRIS